MAMFLSVGFSYAMALFLCVWVSHHGFVFVCGFKIMAVKSNRKKPGIHTLKPEAHQLSWTSKSSLPNQKKKAQRKPHAAYERATCMLEWMHVEIGPGWEDFALR